MNGACTSQPETLCGCCEGIGPETPQPITNRPGLSRISYRAGTHSTFRASMIAALSDPDLPALAALRTRDNTDFAIALLDSFAVTADILTFYAERLVNESYLPTAVDSRSVFELAALVGFVPSPGVSASAYLAYTLNDAPGSPTSTLVSAGSRVQSVPGPGETPQVFETSADLTATIAGNAIPVPTTEPWSISPGQTSTWIRGTSANLAAGDGLLFVSSALHSSLATGPADFHLVLSATPDSATGNTLVRWDQPIAATFPAATDAFLYVLRKKAGLFGSQAPNPQVIKTVNTQTLPGFPTAAGADWTFQYTANSSQVTLDSTIPALAPSSSGEPQWTVLSSPSYVALFHNTDALDRSPNLYALTSKGTQLTVAGGQVIRNLLQTPANINRIVGLIITYENLYLAYLSFYPPLAATFYSLFLAELNELIRVLSPVSQEQALTDFVAQTRNTTAYVASELLTPAAPPLISWPSDTLYPRQARLLRPVEGSALDLVTNQKISRGAPVAISGKRLRIEVATGTSAVFVPDGSSSSLPATVGQVFLVDRFPPDTDALGVAWQVSTPDGVHGTLRPGTAGLRLLPAVQKDPVLSESALVGEVVVNGPITTLSLTAPLARIYDRSTVTANINVVAATNGETMHEILGSGNAANPHLSLPLKQQPLTYVSSPTGTGSTSTLEVWVNNLRWHEAGNLLSTGPADRVFTTHTGPDGKVVVDFGDGAEGARPPTGQLNIRAVYRKGIGAAGMVAAGQLSQPLDLAQGVKSASNPDPASGGADPDTPDAARSSAPLHVLTLERVVSLEDFQNFARAFAGISAALATWTWFGQTRGVFLTVAGANGAILKPDDPTLLNLSTSLRSSGSPFVPVRIASYTPVLFELGARLRIDRDTYDSKLVLAAAFQSLSSAFSFRQGALARGVAQSQVIELLQQIPGVLAVDLTAFNIQGKPPSQPLPAVLRASAPVSGGNTDPSPAEMLLLDPASVSHLEVWS